MLGLGNHARQRMIERNITEQEIEDALAAPSFTRPDDDLPEERTVIYGLTRNGRRLKVVVEAADPGYVVTVMDRDDER